MNSLDWFLFALLLASNVESGDAFGVVPLTSFAKSAGQSPLSPFDRSVAQLAPKSRIALRAVEPESFPETEQVGFSDRAADEERRALKKELLGVCGLCDRGFVATTAERNRINRLVDSLSALTPTADPTAGVDGNYDGVTPLKGLWRLAYTSALDVLSLAANPLSTCGAVYQDARNLPEIVNVIDQGPRAYALLPPNLNLQSTLRLKVFTRAARRSATRVGLDFFAVRAEPKTLAGQDVGFLPAPRIELPRFSSLFGTGPAAEEYPGYFDVKYVDEELLIISQNMAGPGVEGGIFISVKVDPLSEPLPL